MKIHLLKLVLLLVISGNCVSGNGLMAQSNASNVIKVKKCRDFEVTGNGNNSTWGNTDWINIPARRANSDGYATKAKVLYSETGIYFLFNCADKKLTATMKADNLNLYEEDVAEVFMWTQEDFPVYFEYEISPLNYELPLMVPNYKSKFFGWLPRLYDGDRRTRHATSVSGGKRESGAEVSGWTADFFIPYKLLNPLPNVPPTSGTKWRANMYRIDYDQKNSASFSWQKTNVNFHDYNNFGTFEFE
jgi:hypothetical protein